MLGTRLNYIILFYDHCQWQGRGLMPYILVFKSSVTYVEFAMKSLLFYLIVNDLWRFGKLEHYNDDENLNI